jgi:hypothetical protein
MQTIIDDVLNFLIINQVAIYFALGSVAIYLLILFIDGLLQKKPEKKSINLTEHESEISRGIASLDQAFQDKIISQEEYDQFKSDLINKEQK